MIVAQSLIDLILVIRVLVFIGIESVGRDILIDLLQLEVVRRICRITR